MMSNSQVRDHEWMVRPCHIYEEEYRDCKSFKARFNQYFIYGDILDCSQWKQDKENCELWESVQDEEALKQLVKNEKERRYTRLKPHYANDVWKKREKPPEDWNKPLPDWLQERQKNSYLKVKTESMNKRDDDKIIRNEFMKKIFVCTVS